MIISRTPFRISFFGGGTDYPAWFQEHGGSVVGTAIDKYCYLSVRHLPPYFEHRHRIVWSRIELVDRIQDIQHPAVRAVVDEQDVQQGLEITHNSDLPARSGMGSSSSFTVGLLQALYALQGRMTSKQDLATHAIHIEQDVMKEAVGSQDQVWAAYGGMNRIDFLPDGSFAVKPLIMSKDHRRELCNSLMLVFTGFSRYATEIAEKQIANFGNREKQLIELQGMVGDAVSILQDLESPALVLGKLLNEAWKLKRSLADVVSTPAVDEIYEEAISAGAIGGKLCGAGGGGFILLVVRPEDRYAVRNRLRHLIHVNFDFDTEGSKIVVYEPDEFG